MPLRYFGVRCQFGAGTGTNTSNGTRSDPQTQKNEETATTYEEKQKFIT